MKAVLNVIIVSILLVKSSEQSATKDDSQMVRLPSNGNQFQDLAKEVCLDLQFYIHSTVETCTEQFKVTQTTVTPHRSDFRLRCRSNVTGKFQVKPSEQFQLVVLVPDPPDEKLILSYAIVWPNKAFAEISMSPATAYAVFTTTLDKDGRLSPWQRGARIPQWKDEPVPHKEYQIQAHFQNATKNDGGLVTGIITWNQTGDSDVCFEVINRCTRSGIKSIKIWPDAPPQMSVERLFPNDNCVIVVTGLYGKTSHSYQTYAADNDATPELPLNVSLKAEADRSDWNVRVRWLKPRLAPDSYNITLLTDNATRATSIILSGNATEAIFREVNAIGSYAVLFAVHKGDQTAHTSRVAKFPEETHPNGSMCCLESRSGGWVWAQAAGGVWAVAAAGSLAALLAWLRCRTRPSVHDMPVIPETKPLDDSTSEQSSVESWSPVDLWEVKSDRLLLFEVIGEGAFGVVKRGTLSPHGKEVAVKMLKSFPTVEEQRSFLSEMELMKSVGAHPHVVSLVGCCTGRQPLIIAEYCSKGDLLSFLRRSWDVMLSKRGSLCDNNNSIDASEYRSDLFRCNLQRHPCPDFAVNKMYHLQDSCETELTSRDLLSFCRQIAMGMEFLAKNRLVHRDLAARNVLVTDNRTMKIADFGLSRDVYEENQYKQKGNGKMPVKWMAPESLSRRIYSTQSDVWSFGVVVWEVVTVGGTPYQEVPAARLPRLLRIGYRMPRPSNCSTQLYELMLWCWRTAPRERPSFAALHARLDELLNCACADDYLSLELDEEPPRRYFNILMRAKRSWWRGEAYERPLKAPHKNHYSTPPHSPNKIPV